MHIAKLFRKMMKTLLLAGLLLIPLQATAMTFEYSPGPIEGNSILVQTIRDLEICGDLFDVSFGRAFGDDVFIGDTLAAFTAAEAVRFALFMVGAILDLEVFVDGILSNVRFYVALDNTEAWATSRSADWTEPITNDPFNAYVVGAAAGFTMVPAPSVALLLGLGLMALAVRGLTKSRVGSKLEE